MISMSMEHLDGSQRLQVYATADLEAERMVPLAQFDFGTAIPEGFVFSPDGRYLYGSSYYTGISNIFRYEISTQELEAVSNAETGFFRPIPLADGSLLIYEFTGTGFVPSIIDPVPLQDVSATTFLGTEIATKHPVVKEWAVGSPARVPLESMITYEGKYVPREHMELLLPHRAGLQGWYSAWLELGDGGSHPVRHLTVNLSGSVDGTDNDSERIHADVEYQILDWRFQYWHNYADFYDLFGPTERSLKGDVAIVGYTRRLPGKIDFDATVEWYTGLDTLPGNQNVDSGFTELFSANIDLSSAHTAKSLGAVDYEKGYRWNLGLTEDYASSGSALKFHGGFDLVLHCR